MLNLIFRGFFEWAYGLLVEMWEFIADSLLDIMGLDFAYLQTHIPIIPQMMQVIMAAGWALLLGNLVFQALKSMAAGLGFEGEDPKLLFSRTFVFAFLLLASPQICRIGLDLTSNIMNLLSIPDATQVTLVDESIFGSITAAWLMAIICSVIVMFKVLGLILEIAERYVIMAMLAICAPLAFAMGGSKNTASIFSGWCRMFGSMCLLMVTNLVCFKMLFSVLSTVPSGLDVFPWLVLIFAIVKVAHKSDAIITRIGLNPAITGQGHSLLGSLAHTAVRTAVSQLVKGIGGGGGSGGFTNLSAGAGKSGSFFTRFSGGGTGGRGFGPQPSGGSGGSYTYLNAAQPGTPGQSSAQQVSNRQGGIQQGSTAYGATLQATNGSSFNAASQINAVGGQTQQTRRSSVPPGTHRAPSYVPPSGIASTPSALSAAGTTPSQPSGAVQLGTAGTAAVPKSGVSGAPASRSGPAGTLSRTLPSKQPNSAQSGAAGTAAHTQSTRSTHNNSRMAGGSMAYSSVRTSGQTNVTVSKGASGVNAPPTTAPRQSHPGGSAIPADTPKPGEARSTRREKPAATPTSERTRTGAAPQEQRKSAASASSQIKGSAPTVRPGSAGIAPTVRRASGPGQTAQTRTTRAVPAQRPPSRGKGGAGRV